MRPHPPAAPATQLRAPTNRRKFSGAEGRATLTLSLSRPRQTPHTLYCPLVALVPNMSKVLLCVSWCTQSHERIYFLQVKWLKRKMRSLVPAADEQFHTTDQPSDGCPSVKHCGERRPGLLRPERSGERSLCDRLGVQLVHVCVHVLPLHHQSRHLAEF